MSTTALFLMFVGIFGLFILVIWIVSVWKIFEKAGQPGWATIVPIYNAWVYAEVGDKPGWWGLISLLGLALIFADLTSNYSNLVWYLYLIFFFIGLVLLIKISKGIARNFHRSSDYGYLLTFIPFVGFPMLLLTDAKYKNVRSRKNLIKRQTHGIKKD